MARTSVEASNRNPRGVDVKGRRGALTGKGGKGSKVYCYWSFI